MAVIVNERRLSYEFLVVRALSVPLILGMGFQATHVKAIYPGVGVGRRPRPYTGDTWAPLQGGVASSGAAILAPWVPHLIRGGTTPGGAYSDTLS